MKQLKRIVIAGVGLIGGSVGLALKRAGFKGQVVGLGRRWSSLRNAIDVGAVDSATLDYDEAMDQADLLLISTPVDIVPKIAAKAAEYAPTGCIFTDVGSTKGKLVADIEQLMPSGVRFVGTHPMAGSHRSGVGAASASLFDGSICIITPTEASDPQAVDVISEMWRAMGAKIAILAPKDHDCLIAAASHLPHVVACALTRTVAGIENQQGKAIDFAATGFADTTRIASGDPEVWKSILLHNSEMLSPVLKQMEAELAEIRQALDNGDAEVLAQKLKCAKQIRDAFG